MSKTTNEDVSEVRERAVGRFLDHHREHASRWAAAVPIAPKFGSAARTLCKRVKKADVDRAVRAGVPTEVAAEWKALKRENCELCQAKETLRKASANFAIAARDRAGPFLIRA